MCVLGSDVDLRKIAGLTPGFVGADLANLINEAALLAARKNKEMVGSAEFDEAIDRVVGGSGEKEPGHESEGEGNCRLP